MYDGKFINPKMEVPPLAATQYLDRLEHLLREQIRTSKEWISFLRATLPEYEDTHHLMLTYPLRL